MQMYFFWKKERQSYCIHEYKWDKSEESPFSLGIDIRYLDIRTFFEICIIFGSSDIEERASVFRSLSESPESSCRL